MRVASLNLCGELEIKKRKLNMGETYKTFDVVTGKTTLVDIEKDILLIRNDIIIGIAYLKDTGDKIGEYKFKLKFTPEYAKELEEQAGLFHILPSKSVKSDILL
jgi:hypothetical protein